MIILIVIILYLFYCIKKNKVWIICSLIALFPSHQTIKPMLNLIGESSGLFPLWYDMGIFILLWKALYSSHYPIKNLGVLVFFVFMLLYFFSISFFCSKPDPESLSTFRIYLHCIALYIALSIIRFTPLDLKRIESTFIYTAIFYSATGLIIYFFYQQELHLILDHFVIGPRGLEFALPSFQIMGFERMFGLLGGPNQFGLYMSILILCLFFFSQKKDDTLIIKLVIVLAIICITLSFSRAGWGIVNITLTCLYFMNGKISQIVVFFVSLIFLGVVILILMNVLAPNLYDVIMASFNGDEPSASTRGDMVQSGFEEIAQDVFGHGLGTCVEENGGSISESAIVICLYETGILGTVFYIT